MRRIHRSLILAALLLCVAAPGAFAFDFATVKERISEFTLDNGLTVIVMENHSAPVVTCVTYADVGTVDDPKGATGMAHVFEHMAFKGTREVGTNNAKEEAKALAEVDAAFDRLRTEMLKQHLADSAKIARYRAELKAAQDAAGEFVVTNEFGKIVEAEGGVGLNAGTGPEQTIYFFSLPSNRLELWFALESGRFYDPVIREFYKEVDVVKEERRMRIENAPVGKLYEEFVSAAFKAHPYGISGVGHMSDLNLMTRAEAMAFYRTYYVPSNLVVAIIGDVQFDQVREFAKTYFGRLPAAPKPPRLGTVEPPQLGERRVVVEDAAQPFLFIGYHRPAEMHPDDAAIAALADYLGQGRTSVLYKKLVKEEKMAVQVQAIPAFPGSKYPTLIGIVAVPSQDVTATQCEEAILAEIETLKESPIAAEDLDFIKARAKASLINQLSSRTGMAIQLAGYKALYGDWEQLFKELDDINAVTAEDIQRVAREYMTRTNRTVAYIETTDES
jgi:predicted Zn-dependent peptidase